MKTIFDLCVPRADVAEGRIRDEEFAADLANVITPDGKGEHKEYTDPVLFFKHTHPTRGLKSLLEAVCRRLSGVGGETNSVIRLDTQYGGGKTHSLIALVHAVRGMKGVKKPDEFVDPGLLPKGEVRVAALDGENSDPANGVMLEAGLLAHSLWGEMAYQLAGRDGYERVRKSDETHTAPGTTVMTELFGGRPTLILIDEVSVYLRKAARTFPGAADQFSAFIQSLIKAVASTPRCALVFTLAVGADDKTAKDAYKAENHLVVQAFEEAEQVVSRKSTQLNPTEEDETADVLRRRLFESVDLDSAREVIARYVSIWDKNKDSMPPEAFSPETREQFRRGYPLHPETLNTLIEKTSSLSTFQRTRGMLRLLARTVHHLWNQKPADAFAIHPHHIDPGFHLIREEITTKLGQGSYASALAADVAAVPGKDPGTAQRLDEQNYPGQPPVTSYVARTIFLHTLAYGDAAQGIKPEQLRYSVCSPSIEPSFVEAARKSFIADSLYLDDRPGSPMRFRVEPNLEQMVRRAMADVDPDDTRTYLNDRIRTLFDGKGQNFDLVPFPAGPYEIPDDIGDGHPYLAVLGYDAFAVSDEPTSLPAEIIRMATKKGTKEELRNLRNNVVFVVADDKHRNDMKLAVTRRLALLELNRPDRIQDLADYQQRKVKEELEQANFRIAMAVIQCYRHLFYPSHVTVGSGDAQLGHTAIEIANASDSPGNGQLHIIRTLRDQKKLLAAGDIPDAPTFVRDQTPLKTKGRVTTLDLRNEFRRAPKLSILMDNGPLIACIRQGIETSVFIYQKGELLWGPGDPPGSIEISENAFVHTMASAKELGIWPRKPKEEPQPGGGSGGTGGGTGGGGSTGGGGGGSGVGTGGVTIPKPPPSALSAQGPLQQALTELFEKARKANAKLLKLVRIRLFEATPTWSIHTAAANFRDAEITCMFSAMLEGEGIESFSVEFSGSIAKGNAVKSFLEPQLRSTSDNRFEGQYTLTFKTPLPTTTEKTMEFTKSITKYGGGEAYVEAEAAAQEGT